MKKPVISQVKPTIYIVIISTSMQEADGRSANERAFGSIWLAGFTTNQITVSTVRMDTNLT